MAKGSRRDKDSKKNRKEKKRKRDKDSSDDDDRATKRLEKEVQTKEVPGDTFAWMKAFVGSIQYCITKRERAMTWYDWRWSRAGKSGASSGDMFMLRRLIGLPKP